MYYDVYKDEKGEWRWRLKSKNGRTIADSGEGYKRRSGAVKAAHTCWSLNQSYLYDVRVAGTKTRVSEA